MSSQVLRGVHRFTKSTHVSAVHQIPLECGIYSTKDSLSSSPVFLYSTRYRVLPQAKASGLLEDAKAAYDFTRRWEITDESAPKRKVNVGGGSAGFFMAALTAHHLTPTPIALLSITGITTFRHHFFNSSVLLNLEPVTVAQARDVAAKYCLAAWPATTIIQGDDDPDVDIAVSRHVAECLGRSKAKFFLGKGQAHRVEATNSLEVDVKGTGAVREAAYNLEAAVARVGMSTGTVALDTGEAAPGETVPWRRSPS
ncbi:hypothetical protein C8035_v012379 [Colletotrichum spinosum]|uniref:Alpha/beta hydrolase fold-3 domain-containing protein n=1 Tax=Colletotrichum spinosum TaxID=1347390 RepID=A0A4R8Q9B6_9PEZI|nr:hypothetical protein C8035_v012379 [Colletotrichum spinosum]